MTDMDRARPRYLFADRPEREQRMDAISPDIGCSITTQMFLLNSEW